MKIRVLIVDDMDELRDVIREHLLSQHHNIALVGEAATGKEAVYLGTKLKPDVIILDIALPDIDGIRVAHDLKKRLPDLWIVFMTAYGKEYALKSHDLDPVYYLVKPFDLEKLDIVLQEIGVYVGGKKGGYGVERYQNRDKQKGQTFVP